MPMGGVQALGMNGKTSLSKEESSHLSSCHVHAHVHVPNADCTVLTSVQIKWITRALKLKPGLSQSHVFA